MQKTISLKISEELAVKLKKTSKTRGVSMSDLIRSCLESIFIQNSQSENRKEPEIFKYFGIFEKGDEQLQYFRNTVENRKGNYKSRQIEF